MPRVLIVANPQEGGKDPNAMSPYTHLFASEMDCSCLKFVAKGEENIHVLMPAKYESGVLATVRDVFEQAVQAERPYDLIIVDSEACGKEIMRLAESLDPKPAVVIMIPARETTQADALRKKGIAAFCPLESLVDHTTRLSVYDDQLEQALGASGMQRLELKAGEVSATEQWLTLEHGYKEVRPAGIIRTPLEIPPTVSP